MARENPADPFGRPRRIALAAALLATLTTALPAPAAEPEAPSVLGHWLSEKGKVAVRIYGCEAPHADELCGRIVWLAKPFYRRNGKFKRDRKNPDPALRRRGWCGIEVIHGLEAKGDGSWRNGSFYYPKQGTSYDLDIVLESPDRLELRAYLGFRFLGMSELWSRADPEAVKDFACVPEPPVDGS